MKKIIYLIGLLSFSNILSQSLQIAKIEPPNWWSGHSYNQLQLMVYGNNLDSLQVSVDSDCIRIVKVHTPQNSNYSFIDIEISACADPGNYPLKLKNKSGEVEFNYELLKREDEKAKHQGFSTEDVVYLIFPDRFVNGDSSNDFLNNEMEEFGFGEMNGRHGGDIQGIINKLDYLQDLGITAIWSTPLVENNMYMSYHGYAATDFYKIDPRHGTNELYKELIAKAHEKGIKVILDHVANHVGINHPWIKNLPTETWINGTPQNHLPAEHNKTVYVDIHTDSNSIKLANTGWFVKYMPDLNQRDPYLAKYIIQNSIWWIEYAGIDGIREDTYPYADPKFMSIWSETILEHYPNFNIVGEVWKGEPAILAAFQDNSVFPNILDSNLPTVTDFALRDAIYDYLSSKKSLHSIYEIFGQDFVYNNPNNLLVFFDNHDTDRGMYAAKGDLFKYKVGLTLVLMTRGIPQLFYGSEIGLDGGGHHDKIRAPFPGGFPSDSLNAFEPEGRNEIQEKIFNFTWKLLNLRKSDNVYRTGKFVQFQPKDNIYCFYKENSIKKVFFVINANEDSRQFDHVNFLASKLENFTLKDILNEKDIIISDSQMLFLDANSINIFEIYK